MAHWNNDLHPERHAAQQARKWLNRRNLHVTADTRAIVLRPDTCGVSVVSTDPVTLRIRRRSQRGDAPWLLEYAQFDKDNEGRLRFIIDDKLFALSDGRYECVVMQGCDTCQHFQLVLDKRCTIAVGSLDAVDGETVKIVNGEIPNVTDIFQTINTLELNLCAVLEPDVNVLPLSQSDKDAMCALVLCRAVELMISDGVKSEVVSFSGCTDGNVVVARGQAGTSPARFPAGSELCFTWTTNNVVAAAEGCL